MLFFLRYTAAGHSAHKPQCEFRSRKRCRVQQFCRSTPRIRRISGRKTHRRSVGKAAQGGHEDGSKAATANIRKTLSAYKSLPHNALVLDLHGEDGKPVALCFWEAASVEMLAKLIVNAPVGILRSLAPPSLSAFRRFATPVTEACVLRRPRTAHDHNRFQCTRG